MAQNPSRKPKTRRWARRRDEILRVAEEVFAEIGFAAATLEEVARRLELRRPALAYYFDDKEALYDSVFAGILEALGERLSSAFAEEDPLAAMEATTSIWIDFLSERPAAGRVLLRQMVEALPPRSHRTRAVFESTAGQLREVIARGEAQGRFKPIDAGHYGVMIAGTSLLWVSARDALQRAYGFDSTAPEHIESLRHRLVQLTRQLLEVAPTE
jgi:TetR/AcrR family transcriptional regulator